jgi:Protein of unknown function (DUF2569)
MNEEPNPTTAINLTQTAAPLNEPKYKGVGGWLLFFCISLTVFSPLITIVMGVASYSVAFQLLDRFPGVMAVTVIDTFLSLGLMAFSVYAGVSLWRVKSGAVQTAKRYLSCLLAYVVVASILPLMAGLPSEANEGMILEIIKDASKKVFYVAIWYAYLNKSKRVRATFQIEEESNVTRSWDT